MSNGEWTLLPGTSTGLIVRRPLSVNLERELIRRGNAVVPISDIGAAVLERTYDGALVLALEAASGQTFRVTMHDGSRSVLHEITRRLLAEIIPRTSIPMVAARPALTLHEVATFVSDPQSFAARETADH